jgi:outer membrane protein assembly factor BamB
MTRRLARSLAYLLVATMAACGGGSSSGGGSSASGTGSATAPSAPAAAAPTITTQPANASATVGNTTTFTVVASGTAPLSYQWQKGGTAITGGTSASYTTPALVAGDNGSMFSVVVTNSAGGVTSGTATLSVTVAAATASGDVTTFKNDVARTGQYLTETTLTPANVNSTSFGLLKQLPVDGKVDAQPLYLSQLTVSGAAHNVVYVATEHGSVYAIDADTGTTIWQVSLLASGETSSGAQGCDQVVPEIGITSTPVIDRTAGPNGAIYVIAMSLDKSSIYHQRLHALDITTGGELFGGPTDISATFPNAGGTTTFAPGQYEERAALLLSNGTIYTSWTSHCDAAPYSGWIIAFDQKTLARTLVLNVGPNSGAPQSGGNNFSINGPGIWMSGDGPAADANGNIYLLTGNGPFETTLNSGGFPNMGDYGNSAIKMTATGPTLGVADYFTMFNEVSESMGDQDLGSGGEMLLPDLTDSTNTVRHLVLSAGKDGNIYVVDRDSMGKFNATKNNIYQEIDGILGGEIRSSPAYFNSSVYYGPNGGTLKAFSVTSAKLSTAATSQSATQFAYPGTSPVICANGTTNAIVWTHENTTPAVLHAYDATNLAHELYNSNQATGARDQFGAGNKFITPTVAGGKVFVGTTTELAIFGPLH